jgi:hypothetical protein
MPHDTPHTTQRCSYPHSPHWVTMRVQSTNCTKSTGSRQAARALCTPGQVYENALSICPIYKTARCSLLAARCGSAAALRAHEVAPVARPQHRSAANGACRVLAACCRFSFSDELSCASTTTLLHNHCCGVTFLQFAQSHLAWCIRTGHVHALVMRTDEMHAVWCTAAQMSGSGTRSQWYSGSGSDTQWRWYTVAVVQWQWQRYTVAVVQWQWQRYTVAVAQSQWHSGRRHVTLTVSRRWSEAAEARSRRQTCRGGSSSFTVQCSHAQ